MLKALSLIVGLIALLSVVWIIVPAPARSIWLFSVAASEWSLWFGAPALIGIICSLAIPIFAGEGKLWLISLAISALALAISLYPFFSALPAAREHNVSLSFAQYFSGLQNNSTGNKPENFAARTFLQIEGRDLRLDVYSPPENAVKNGASVIVVHGGSWRSGERSDFPQWNRWLAAQGFTVFDVDYRLAPQPNYLTATGDVKCAVRWVKEHAAEFGVSPDRIALFGRSAGAHLALLAAYSAEDERLPATCAEKQQDEKIRAVVSFYAPTDLIWGFDNPANQRVIIGPATLADFLGGNPHESAEIRERFALASPVAHVSARTPPTLLVHGGQDQLVRTENMFILSEKLKQAGTAHKTILIPYAQHGFDYNSNGWGAQVTKTAMLDFLYENTVNNRFQ
jgi:acetyl esterase/lipase